MKVRAATREDVQSISDIANACITRSEDKPGVGLIDYPETTAEKYLSRMKYGHFIVAEMDGEVCGFFDFYAKKHLHKVWPDDPVINEVYKRMEDNELYVHTLAIHPDYQGRGLGTELIGKPVLPLWGAIVTAPARNLASLKLVKKHHFYPVVNVEAHGLTFTIVHKN